MWSDQEWYRSLEYTFVSTNTSNTHQIPDKNATHRMDSIRVPGLPTHNHRYLAFLVNRTLA